MVSYPLKKSRIYVVLRGVIQREIYIYSLYVFMKYPQQKCIKKANSSILSALLVIFLGFTLYSGHMFLNFYFIAIIGWLIEFLAIKFIW